MRKLFYIPIVLLVAVMISCEKPGDLGEDLINLQDSKINVEFTDTLTVIAYSLPVDSVSTSKLKYNLLGSSFDNIFGTTTASIYTQLRLSQNNADFGTNPICDSIILTLDYTGFYGDSNSVQTLKIYEVIEDMYFDSTYFSSDSLSVNSSPIGTMTTPFNINDSVSYGGIMIEPHLVFHLNKSFGEKIIAKSGQSELSDNENFKNFIKGILITAEKTNNQGGMAFINMMSGLSTLSLYYHNDADTLVYKFAINEFCSYFSTFNHYGYADASPNFKAQVINGDHSLGNQSLYIQSLGGVKTRFYIPYLQDLAKNGPIAVQNAALLINIESGTDAGYEPIYGLAVVKLDSLGTAQFIDDYYEGSTYFGGDYNSTDKYYSFNLNRYIQSIVSGKQKHYGLELVAKGASIYGNRTIFAGPQAVNKPFKLRLTYTRVN